MNKINKMRIVVTGMGPVCSMGFDRDSVWRNILNEKTNLQLEKVTIDRKITEEFYLHKLRDFKISNFGIERELLEEIESWKRGADITDLHYLIVAIKLAMEDSRLSPSPGSKIGLVISNENPGLGTFCARIVNETFKILNRKVTKAEYFKEFFMRFSRQAYDLQTFMPLYHIAKLFKIHGYSLFVNNACASGLYAIDLASQIIKSKRCKVVVVAASDQPDVFKYLWFKGIHMYAQDGKIKPFSRNSNGFVFGEGGAALILEELTHARRRKAPIYGEYLGGGFSFEGFKVTLPHVGSNFYADAIKEALAEAKLSVNDVDFICAHGVGTNIADRYEAMTISKIFKHSTPISAFKPYVGNNLGGCSLLETLIMLLAMESSIIPPILNCEETHPKINMNLIKSRLVTEIKTSLKICSAFAGYNGAVVFRKFKQ